MRPSSAVPIAVTPIARTYQVPSATLLTDAEIAVGAVVDAVPVTVAGVAPTDVAAEQSAELLYSKPDVIVAEVPGSIDPVNWRVEPLADGCPVSTLTALKSLSSSSRLRPSRLANEPISARRASSSFAAISSSSPRAAVSAWASVRPSKDLRPATSAVRNSKGVIRLHSDPASVPFQIACPVALPVKFTWVDDDPPAVPSGMMSPHLSDGPYVTEASNTSPVCCLCPLLSAPDETLIRRYGLVTDRVRWQISTLFAASTDCGSATATMLAPTRMPAKHRIKILRTG